MTHVVQGKTDTSENEFQVNISESSSKCHSQYFNGIYIQIQLFKRFPQWIYLILMIASKGFRDLCSICFSRVGMGLTSYSPASGTPTLYISYVSVTWKLNANKRLPLIYTMTCQAMLRHHSHYYVNEQGWLQAIPSLLCVVCVYIYKEAWTEYITLTTWTGRKSLRWTTKTHGKAVLPS